MTAVGLDGLAVRLRDLLQPDPSRVLARLFVPGQEHLIHGRSRVDPVIERILQLDAATVAATLAHTQDKFAGRHNDLRGVLQRHFQLIDHRIEGSADLSGDAQLLIGAYFTQEYSVESAAIFNPSIVVHPDQSGVGADELRVVISLRAVGEGHLSSIEFRSGLIGADGGLRLDDPGRYLTDGRLCEPVFGQDQFRRVLAEMGEDGEDAIFVLDSLPDPFTAAELDQMLAQLHAQLITRRSADRTVDHLRQIAGSNYTVEFPADSMLGERVLMPRAAIEAHGMEDARLVRFRGDDGEVVYYATYTAYDGQRVAPQLIETRDFVSFNITQLTGPAAANKGMALFPRPIQGRRYALSRWDRANLSIATSTDGHTWLRSATVAEPHQPWELIQLGNCGSPIETSQGWLVLTHGVGPMRSYAIGALLLDLNDPTKVLGQLTEPLLVPAESERNGYVPNVVYTCGAIVHRDRLVIPYGVADRRVAVAVVNLPTLLDVLLTGGPPA